MASAFAELVAIARREGRWRSKSCACEHGHSPQQADAPSTLLSCRPAPNTSSRANINEARKVATYDGDDPDLGEASLEDLAADVEAAVVIAERETKR